MEAIIINNKIKLVDQSTWILLTIKVPFGCLQKMINQTGCIIKSVKEINLDFNHNAGRIALAEIKVRFDKIRSSLQWKSVYECENFKAFKEMYIDLEWRHGFHVYTDNTKLYAFGTPIIRRKSVSSNGHYVNAKGNKISLNNQFDKYVDFKGEKYVRIAIV